MKVGYTLHEEPVLNIQMIEIGQANIEQEGKYLVRTRTNIGNIQYVYTRVFIHKNKYTIDINNQTVTHISIKPLG